MTGRKIIEAMGRDVARSYCFNHHLFHLFHHLCQIFFTYSILFHLFHHVSPYLMVQSPFFQMVAASITIVSPYFCHWYLHPNPILSPVPFRRVCLHRGEPCLAKFRERSLSGWILLAMVPQFGIAKLMKITPISLGFMVDIPILNGG